MTADTRRRTAAALLATVAVAGLLVTVPAAVAATSLPEFRSSVRTIDAALAERMSLQLAAGLPGGRCTTCGSCGLRYWGFDGEAHRGRLVVHRAWARGDRERLRRSLRGALPDPADAARRRVRGRRHAVDAGRQHERVQLPVPGRDVCVWSQHAYGRAVDINPVENPWVGSWGVSPPNGAAYATGRRCAGA